MEKQTLEARLELYVTEKKTTDNQPNKLLLAASAVAGVGAVLVPPPAEAAVVYSGERRDKISAGSLMQTVDFDGDGNGEFIFSLYADGTTYYSQILNVGERPDVQVIKDGNDPGKLQSNYTISSKKQFSTVDNDILAATLTSATGKFLDEKGFLGVKFKVGDNTHYGWIQYEANGDASVGTIIDWAYEDTPGKGIKAGSTISMKSFNWNLFLPAIINGHKQ